VEVGPEVMMQHLRSRYIGLDVHKASIAVAIAEEDGPPSSYGHIANDPTAIRKLMTRLGGPDVRLRVAYEAGPTGYALHRQMSGYPTTGVVRSREDLFQVPRSTKLQVRRGDLLWIPVCPDKHAVGIVLHLSKYIRNGMIVGFFHCPFKSEEDVHSAELELSFMETPKWTSQQLVSEGYWKIIGNRNRLLVALPPLFFRIGSSLYQNDTPVGRVDEGQWGQYPELLAWGGKAIENHLRELFCAESAAV